MVGSGELLGAGVISPVHSPTDFIVVVHQESLSQLDNKNLRKKAGKNGQVRVYSPLITCHWDGPEGLHPFVFGLRRTALPWPPAEEM